MFRWRQLERKKKLTSGELNRTLSHLWSRSPFLNFRVFFRDPLYSRLQRVPLSSGDSFFYLIIVNHLNSIYTLCLSRFSAASVASISFNLISRPPRTFRSKEFVLPPACYSRPVSTVTDTGHRQSLHLLLVELLRKFA